MLAFVLDMVTTELAWAVVSDHGDIPGEDGAGDYRVFYDRGAAEDFAVAHRTDLDRLDSEVRVVALHTLDYLVGDIAQKIATLTAERDALAAQVEAREEASASCIVRA